MIISTFAATIMKIGYGIAVRETNDPYISVAEEVLDGLTQAGVPGAFLVDLIPILKYVPSWFPGAGFQKKAARWRKANHIMAEKPFCHVKEQLVQFFFVFLRVHALVQTMFSTENWKSYAIGGSKPHRASA